MSHGTISGLARDWIRTTACAGIASLVVERAAGDISVTIHSFPPGIYESDAGAMDERLGIKGFRIEDFDDTALIDGLMVGFGNPDVLPSDSVPASALNSNPWEDWAGTVTSTLWNNTDSDPTSDHDVVTCFVDGDGVRSFGLGISNMRFLGHTLLINGRSDYEVTNFPDASSSTLASFAPNFVASSQRVGYLRIDVNPGSDPVHSIGIDRRSDPNAAWRPFGVDHVAFLKASSSDSVQVDARETLLTAEGGMATNFDVVLTVQPSAPVTLSILCSDPTEGVANPERITFTPADWDKPQTVTVSGVDDTLSDGNVRYLAILDPAGSVDANYANLAPTTVPLLNADDETSAPLVAKFVVPDGKTGDLFGDDIAVIDGILISSATMVGGTTANRGSVFLLDLETAEQEELDRSPANNRDFFGRSVAASNIAGSSWHRILVGAPEADAAGVASGAAYQYSVTNQGQVFGPFLHKPDSPGEGDLFGSSVALDTRIALVGAPSGDQDDSGAIYLFHAILGTRIAKLKATDVSAGANLGWSVALEGAIAMAGAPNDDSLGQDAGAAYLFDLPEDPATSKQRHKLQGNDTSVGDRFGAAVALSHGIAIVGASGHDSEGDDAGAAYVFDSTTGVQLAKLVAADPIPGMQFGWSVAIEGGVVLIGTKPEGTAADNPGAAYLFDVGTGEQRAKLVPPDGCAGDFFGHAVEIGGGKAFVSAHRRDGIAPDTGAVYAYEIPGITVTGAGDRVADDGVVTLREAILAANSDQSPSPDTPSGSGPDVITFDPALFRIPRVIELGSPLPDLNTDVRIRGPTSGGVTIRRVEGGADFRIFTIASGVRATIENLNIANGLAAEGGGILNHGELMLRGCTIYNNRSLGGGGGILTQSADVDAPASLSIVGCTISGNSAESDNVHDDGGGGVLVRSGEVVVTSTTIYGNSTGALGGGVEVKSGSIQLWNSLLAGNNDLGERVSLFGDFNFISSDANVASLGHNLIQQAPFSFDPEPTDQVGVDPLLDGQLKNNGGSTLTHVLLSESPAIDAGVDTGLVFDQTGGARRYDTAVADGSQSDGSDVGSVEFQPNMILTLDGVRIEHGDSASEVVGATDFGEVVQRSVVVERTFAIANGSGGRIQTSSIELPPGFHLVRQTAYPDGSGEFTIGLGGYVSRGLKEGNVVIRSNDASHPEFTFGIQGFIRGPVAELEVAASVTSFGGVNQLFDPPSRREFTLRNTGDSALTIEAIDIQRFEDPAIRGGFAILQDLPGTVLEPGQEMNFTVQMDMSQAGVHLADLLITTDDFDAPVIEHVLEGDVFGPELTVLGNGNVIDPGDPPEVAADDHRHFGKIRLGAAAPEREFVIRNDGWGEFLELQWISIDERFPEFELTAVPDDPTLLLPDLETSSIGLRLLDTGSLGTRVGTVTIRSNDLDDPYSFSLEAEIVQPIAAVGIDANEISNGGLAAAASGTDFGSVPLFAAMPESILTLRNDGGVAADVTIIGSEMSGFLLNGVAPEPGHFVPLGNLEPGGKLSLSVQLQTEVFGEKRGVVTLLITGEGFQDLLEFEVAGRVLAPEIVVRRGGSNSLQFVRSYHDGQDDGQGNLIGGIEGVRRVALSPDGGSLYSGSEAGAISLFARDARDGRLTWVESHETGLATAVNDLSVSPDGEHVYYTGDPQVIGMFARNEFGGLSKGEPLTLQEGVGNATVVSEDGQVVYTGDSGVGIYRRDPATGSLVGIKIVESIESLADVRVLATSPGGKHLYVGSGEILTVFEQTTSSENLRLVGRWVIDGGMGTGGALAISPDGIHVYAAASGGDSLIAFHRDVDTGQLSVDGDPYTQTGLSDVRSIAISPDARQVFVGIGSTGSISVFDRNPLTGRLEFDRLLENNGLDAYGNTISGLGIAPGFDIVSSPDGNQVYVASGAIALFDRDNIRQEIPLGSDGAGFGEALAGHTFPQRSFTVSNEGNVDLRVSSIDLPPGFVLVDSSPGAFVIPPGGDHVIVVALDTHSGPGAYGGEVRITSDDHDEGLYTFQVRGSVLPAPPVIIAQPLGVNIDAFNNVAIAVSATGTEPITYRWRFNGVDISGADGSTLILNSVEVDQSGAYSVVVSNDVGSVESESAELAVTKVAASVSLSQLEQRFNATPREVTVTTDPPGLDVLVEYDGSPVGPVDEGSYAVVATVIDPNYMGAASGTFVITSLSWLDDIMSPEPLPPTGGAFTMNIQPEGIRGQWRFVGELFWRNGVNEGGIDVHGIVSGIYEVEFKPVNGYTTPGNITFSATVQRDQQTPIQRFGIYDPTPDGGGGSGRLRVDVSPGNLGNESWRLQSDAPDLLRDGGAEIVLPEGVYLVEFASRPGHATPAPRLATIVPNQLSLISSSYLFAHPVGGLLPSQVSFSNVKQLDPFGFNGQIQTRLGFASGVVVREMVVLTAAHALFDDHNFAYVDRVQWFQQRVNDQHEPPPLEPRGWYIFEGYAAQRQAENNPGNSSPLSQQDDVAVLFFVEENWRGGQGGYLAGVDAGNEWLTGNRRKYLVGYPVEGRGQLANLQAGRMYATGETITAFEQVTATAPDVYAIDRSEMQGLPGMSGCPLYVKYNPADPEDVSGGRFYPAGVYLGGTGKTVVRVIDDDVVEMIDRAVVSSNEGGNSTGGGIAYQFPGATDESFERTGVVSINMNLPGGRWRFSFEEPDKSRSSVEPAIVGAGNYTIVFDEVVGFVTPAPLSIAVGGGQTNVLEAEFVPRSTETFQSWSAKHFRIDELADPSISGLEADPDCDGVENLLEWAFGLVPVSPDRRVQGAHGPELGLPKVSTLEDGGITSIRLEFTRLDKAVAPSLSYVAEFSYDMVNWSPGGTEVFSEAIGALRRRVVVEDQNSAGLNSIRFARVRVTIEE